MEQPVNTCRDLFVIDLPAVVQEHENDIDSRLVPLIQDFLYRQSQDMLLKLKPIAAALDQLQSDKSGLSDACHEWLSL